MTMRLRVVSYNVKDGGLGREALILQVLKDARADVIVMQEVYGLASVQQWAEALGMEVDFGRGNTSRHLAILSKLPIVSSQLSPKSTYPHLPSRGKTPDRFRQVCAYFWTAFAGSAIACHGAVAHLGNCYHSSKSQIRTD